jgi:hypothetical protein
MKQSPLLKFESSAFAVIPGEDEQTNPGIYGKTLAEWLGEQLRLAGVAAEKVIAEDFGWCVSVKAPPYSLYVACANDEAAGHWQVFTFVEGGLMDRILRKDKSAGLLAPLHATVRRCLESSSAVHGLREESLDMVTGA